jgi:hypothetical protein
MPLTEGREWSYSVRAGFQDNVVTIKVGPQVNVGEYNGYTLTSPVGDSRMAWAGSQLIVSQFANSRFNPPLPIFNEAKIPSKRRTTNADKNVEVARWKGKIESFGKIRGATARLIQSRDSHNLITGKTDTVLSIVQIDLEDGKGMIELRTHFVRSKGIVLQEQSTNQTNIVRMELLNNK